MEIKLQFQKCKVSLLQMDGRLNEKLLLQLEKDELKSEILQPPWPHLGWKDSTD